MNYYRVGDLLIRRRTPVRKGIVLQAWNGRHWVAYTDVDAVLRHGYPLSEPEALRLTHRTEQDRGTVPHPGKVA